MEPRHSSQTQQQSVKSEKQFREELEALNKESYQLNEQRVRIQAEVERAKKEKAELEEALMAEFGTCDIDELGRILAEREKANEASLAAYRSSLVELKREISEVNQKLAQIR